MNAMKSRGAPRKQTPQKILERAALKGLPLTPRERHVADGLLRARTNKEIADDLSISCETVREHVQHILEKFGMERRGQVAVHMLREQLTAEALGKEFFDNASGLIMDLEEKLSQLHVLLDGGLSRTSRKTVAKK